MKAVLAALWLAGACATADGGADGGPPRSDGALLPDAGGLRGDGGGVDAEPHGDAGPLINEFVADHGGEDACEYVEVIGAPGADYGRYTILTVEGDAGNNPGQVQAVVPVGTTSAEGYWVSSFLANQLQNGSSTVLLVADFAGGTPDVDSDDDGAFDRAPWSMLVDAVAVHDGSPTDVTYGVALTRTFDGEDSVVGGASRIPDGADSDQATDWVRNLSSADGLPCATGGAGLGAAQNTPGEPNRM